VSEATAATILQDRDGDGRDDYRVVRPDGAVASTAEVARELAGQRLLALARLADGSGSEAAGWLVDTTVRRSSVAPQVLTVRDGKAVHAPQFSALYRVDVVDANRCKGSAVREVTVDQHRIDFTLGIDYSRVSGEIQTAAPAVEDPGAQANQEDEPQVDEMSGGDDNLRELFEDPIVLFGLEADQYLLDFLRVFGRLTFGGSNVEAKVSSTTKLAEVRTFQVDLGLQYDLGCGPSTQACFYAKGEYGLLVPEEAVVEGSSRDQLDRWFAGLGWRYHRPGHRFHGSFTEAGLGRSDNFEENGDRFKLRGEVHLDLDDTWALRFRAELDSDGGQGPDDLRVLFGAKRDFSFLAETFAKLLGIGGKEGGE
jgi:hypothetical protein